MENSKQDQDGGSSSEDSGAMVTFAWRPPDSLTGGKVVCLVQLAGNFTEWEPVEITPAASHPKFRSLSCNTLESIC